MKISIIFRFCILLISFILLSCGGSYSNPKTEEVSSHIDSNDEEEEQPKKKKKKKGKKHNVEDEESTEENELSSPEEMIIGEWLMVDNGTSNMAVNFKYIFESDGTLNMKSTDEERIFNYTFKNKEIFCKDEYNSISRLKLEKITDETLVLLHGTTRLTFKRID
jgi:hypothetical protein